MSEDRDSLDFSQPVELSELDKSASRPKTRPGVKTNLQLQLDSQNVIFNIQTSTKNKPQTGQHSRKISMLPKSVNSSINLFSKATKDKLFYKSTDRLTSKGTLGKFILVL